MKRYYTPWIAAAMLIFGSIAIAYPTFNGQTGMVALPNALIADSGSIVGAADVIFSETNTFKARVLKGYNNQAEMGAGFSVGEDDGINISGKYRFNEGQAKFNLAVGGSITLANNDDSGIDLYVVGTQSFTKANYKSPLWWGSFGMHLISVDEGQTLKPFIGAQFPLGSDAQIAAEYQFNSGNHFKRQLASVVYRHQFNSLWAGQIGVTNATGFGTTSDYRAFLGAKYTFQSR